MHKIAAYSTTIDLRHCMQARKERERGRKWSGGGYDMDASATTGCWYLPWDKRRKNTPKIGLFPPIAAASLPEFSNMVQKR